MSELPSNMSQYIETETIMQQTIEIEDDDTTKLTAALQSTRDRLKKLKKASVQDDAADSVLKITQTQAPDATKFECMYCDYNSKFQFGLKHHIRKYHAH